MRCRLTGADRVAKQGEKEFEEFKELQEFRMGYVGALLGRALKLISGVPSHLCGGAHAYWVTEKQCRRELDIFVPTAILNSCNSLNSSNSFLSIPSPGAAPLSRPLQDAPNRYAAKAGPNRLRFVEQGNITRLIRDTPAKESYPSKVGTNTNSGPPFSAERDCPFCSQTNPIS